MSTFVAFIIGAYFGALVMALCVIAHIKDEPCNCCQEMMGADGRCGDGCHCGARHEEE